MFKEKDRAETLFGVLFGVIVVAAVCIEMAMDGFSAASVVSAVKDVASTAIVFIALLVFINEHRKASGFRGSVESKMKEIEKAYAPLIRQAEASETSGETKKAKLERVIRYEIASNTNALFGTKGMNYSAFFDINAEAPEKIEFYIRRKFFGDMEEGRFDAERIAGEIEKYMRRHYSELNTVFSPDASGGKLVISFSSRLESKKDVEKLIGIIDDMAFVYVAMKQGSIRE